MVYVPAGEFLMGSADDDEAKMSPFSEPPKDWFAAEKPQGARYLNAFWIDKTEVTNAQYLQCVEAGACEEPACWGADEYEAELPVVCVSWDNAQAYATWVGGRLPTEAEWEKAARGINGSIWPWGNSSPNCYRANFSECVGHPLAVGTLTRGISPYGAFDMAGNVAEWVADWFDPDYYARSPFWDPQGPSRGDRRVLRGGSFMVNKWGIRSAIRSGYDPSFLARYVGFRVAMPAAEQ
jgi:formylglycine-generating enzyme required for sulfatase activity